jgi:hypothetical protein
MIMLLFYNIDPVENTWELSDSLLIDQMNFCLIVMSKVTGDNDYITFDLYEKPADSVVLSTCEWIDISENEFEWFKTYVRNLIWEATNIRTMDLPKRFQEKYHEIFENFNLCYPGNPEKANEPSPPLAEMFGDNIDLGANVLQISRRYSLIRLGLEEHHKDFTNRSAPQWSIKRDINQSFVDKHRKEDEAEKPASSIQVNSAKNDTTVVQETLEEELRAAFKKEVNDHLEETKENRKFLQETTRA